MTEVRRKLAKAKPLAFAKAHPMVTLYEGSTQAIVVITEESANVNQQGDVLSGGRQISDRAYIPAMNATRPALAVRATGRFPSHSCYHLNLMIQQLD